MAIRRDDLWWFAGLVIVGAAATYLYLELHG